MRRNPCPAFPRRRPVAQRTGRSRASPLHCANIVNSKQTKNKLNDNCHNNVRASTRLSCSKHSINDDNVAPEFRVGVYQKALHDSTRQLKCTLLAFNDVLVTVQFNDIVRSCLLMQDINVLRDDELHMAGALKMRERVMRRVGGYHGKRVPCGH